MAIETRNQLYTYFETGDAPTADQFKNLIDSQINQASDGVTATLLSDATSAIGLSNTNTIARLNISGNPFTGNLLSMYKDMKAADHWMFTDTTVSGTSGGLNFTQNTLQASTSRLFIQFDGKVGMGTTAPGRKLELAGTTANDFTGIKFYNTAASGYGWGAGHLHNSVGEKNSSFVIYEEGDSSGIELPAERFTILRGGNVGINETLPDTKLHVSRSLSDPDMLIDFREGTGIAIFGPIEENITVDSQGVQARAGSYIGERLILAANTLNLQPMGGVIVIHSDDSLPPSARVVITEEGSLGIGTTSPVERIDIDGAIKIGRTSNISPNPGTIRWSGVDFEGYDGTAWQSFTEGSQVWLEVTDTNSIYYAPSEAKVGIGTVSPSHALHVLESTVITTRSVSLNSVAAFIHNTSSSDNTGITDMRVGLQIVCDTMWSSFDGPTNIGLYVSDVSGQTASNENYAAILNGNVVVGNMTGNHLVGTNGANVLAIQNGTPPSSAAGGDGSGNGIQIYSTNVSDVTLSVFHVMNGNGKVVKLFEGAALTASVATELSSPPTYGDVEKRVIENLRARVNELEARLKALGLLPTV